MIKGILHDANELVRRRKAYDKSGNLDFYMLDKAGTEVVIKEIEFPNKGVRFKLKGDRDDNWWYPWMFKTLPPIEKPTTIKLSQTVNGYNEVRVFPTGHVKIGCAMLPPTDVSNVYNAVQKAMTKAAKKKKEKKRG